MKKQNTLVLAGLLISSIVAHGKIDNSILITSKDINSNEESLKIVSNLINDGLIEVDAESGNMKIKGSLLSILKKSEVIFENQTTTELSGSCSSSTGSMCDSRY
jgi:hypothetical protein